MGAHMVATLSDFQLARASAAGNEEAFEALYRHHHRRVYSVCLRMLRDRDEAEEVTQEVFLQVYRKIGGFRGTSAFTTWLHRLTVNKVLMYLRRKRRWQTEESFEPDKLQVVMERGVPPRPESPLIEPVDLERAVNRLPAGYRMVFLLHDIEGYEHAEISQLLGVSVGTTKSQLHKARLKLRRMLCH